MRTLILTALLTLPGCWVDIDFPPAPAGDGTGWDDETTGTPETSGSTGLGASESEAGDMGSTSTSSTSTDEGSSSGESSEGTTGAAERCVASPVDASCSCVVYDGVCACIGGNFPSNACSDACECDVPDDELPCGLVMMDGHPTCTCVDTPADPAECGCAMVGDVCACGANVYPLETCLPEAACVPGLPCWCDDLVPPQPCPAASNPLDAACSCYISGAGCVCPSGTMAPELCQLC